MATYELNFRDYIRIFQKRYWLLVLSIVVTTFVVLIRNALQVPVYSATVTVRVEERKTLVGSILDRPIYYGGGASDYLASEMRIIKSRPVAEAAGIIGGFFSAKTPRDQVEEITTQILSHLDVQQEEKTNLVKITSRSSNPELAARAANSIAKAYQEENLKQKNRESLKNREFVEKQLSQMEGKLRVSEDELRKFKEKETASGIGVLLTQRLADLEGQLSQLLAKATELHPDVLKLKDQIAGIKQQLKNLPESELEYVRLSRDVDVNDRIYRMLRDRVEEARIDEAGKVSDVTIVNPAGQRGIQIGANKLRSLFIALAMGIVIGFILILVLENLDTSIGTIEDVENLIKLPVLGVIPSVKREKEDKGAAKTKPALADNYDLVFTIAKDANSPFAESFRILRTNLKIEKNSKRTLLITSTGPREGKSTVMVGLGLVFAQMGLNTLLVDTDLRRPSLSKIFGVEREPGLNELLLGGGKDLEKIVKNFTDFLMGNLGFDKVTQLPGLETLSLLTSGALTSSAAELLSSDAMTQCIRQLQERFDVVIFDTPPALSLTDASILAKKIEGVIIVYEMGRTSRDALLRTKIQLESVGAKILGVILNHTRPQTEFQTSYYPYYRSYKYKYYYSSEEHKDKKKESEAVK